MLRLCRLDLPDAGGPQELRDETHLFAIIATLCTQPAGPHHASRDLFERAELQDGGGSAEIGDEAIEQGLPLSLGFGRKLLLARLATEQARALL